MMPIRSSRDVKIAIKLADSPRPTAGNSLALAGPAWHHGRVLNEVLAGYQATGETEAADLERMRQLAQSAADPWSRSQLPLHLTGSALVVHPPTHRVLLRWHYKHDRWLQVGGHGDPGETDPLQIALREAREETGLSDLVPWPDRNLQHVALCYVRASGNEPEHEHGDLRYFLATERPDAIAAENEQSPLRWLTIGKARALVGDNNLSETLTRAERLFDRDNLG
jgi:8-oxo-dGTP pyrophosphatase MutT (NUDIX family)